MNVYMLLYRNMELISSFGFLEEGTENSLHIIPCWRFLSSIWVQYAYRNMVPSFADCCDTGDLAHKRLRQVEDTAVLGTVWTTFKTITWHYSVTVDTRV